MTYHPHSVSKTEYLAREPKLKLQIYQLLYPERDYWKPKTRADCARVPRPCPYVSCRFNTLLDIGRSKKTIQYPHDREPWEVPPEQSCVLDIAEQQGPLTLEEIGAVMNLTRERVRQIEQQAFEKLVPLVQETIDTTP